MMRTEWRPRRFEVILVTSLIVGLWFVLLFAFARARDIKRGGLCQSNLKQIGLASKQYERDYDERFPLPGSWTAGLLPYHKSPKGFHCPSALRNGYAVNKYLTGLQHQQIYTQDVRQIPQYFETQTLQDNASGAGETWLSRPRHPQGVALVYMDGHFEWRRHPPRFRSFASSQPKSRRKK